MALAMEKMLQWSKWRNKSSQGPVGFFFSLSEKEEDKKKITIFSLDGSVHHEAVNWDQR